MFDHYEWFKNEVYRLTQIDLNYYKEKQMRRRIDTLAKKNGADSYETYIDMISADKAKFKQFINFITINVSEFYRNPDQWSFLDREVIPEILKNNTGTIKIWSAACSTGDEPYSLAMAFSKHVPLSRIKILATDIDDQVIASAKAGLYSAKSVENVPADLKKKYFTQVEGSYKISDDIKCRNVVIYFTDDAKDMIYKNFFNTLKSKGILFIGSTEQITTYRELGFERLSSFYFRKP